LIFGTCFGRADEPLEKLLQDIPSPFFALVILYEKRRQSIELRVVASSLFPVAFVVASFFACPYLCIEGGVPGVSTDRKQSAAVSPPTLKALPACNGARR
jgi:hypothetical protein